MSRLPRVLRTLKDLRSWNLTHRKAGSSIGLVPTMGALHAGHLALLNQSMTENNASVASIFVNPSQFAPTEDLTQYPRTFDSDLEKIAEILHSVQQKESVKKDVVVFAPSVAEMYPSGIVLERDRQIGTFVEVLGFSHQLEGSIRPHFFRGVATVVTKLLHAAMPDVAYFGQKDMQQCAVVKRMVSDLLFPVEVRIGETYREANGLAMSSRNEYLAPETREKASIIYKALQQAQQAFKTGTTDREQLLKIVRDTLLTQDIIEEIQYASLNDANSLANLDVAEKGSVISTAVSVRNDQQKNIRLLDNIVL